MSASDHLSGSQFYHGTTAKLSPGDWITPARNRGVPGNVDVENSLPHTYFTDDISAAKTYTGLAANAGQREKYVYQVQPAAPYEADPNHPRESSYRSRGPLLVHGVAQSWGHESHPDDLEIVEDER